MSTNYLFDLLGPEMASQALEYLKAPSVLVRRADGKPMTPRDCADLARVFDRDEDAEFLEMLVEEARRDALA